MHFEAGIHRPKGGRAQVIRPDRRCADQHDAILERPGGDGPAQNVGYGDMRKRVGRAEIVDQQLAALVGRDEPVAHLHALDSVALDSHRQSRAVEVLPRREQRQRREQVLADSDHERHPPKHTVPVTPQRVEAG